MTRRACLLSLLLGACHPTPVPPPLPPPPPSAPACAPEPPDPGQGGLCLGRFTLDGYACFQCAGAAGCIHRFRGGAPVYCVATDCRDKVCVVDAQR